MKRILYCVHRYAPHPGGSENYVRDLAEATSELGHETWVFAGNPDAILNGVRITHNPEIIFEKWDLIVVHGGDVGLQNFVLSQANKLQSPILYLLILPSQSETCVQALKDCHYLGCSTLADWRHLAQYDMETKGVQISHGIDLSHSGGMADPSLLKSLELTTPYFFLSCGGYWPNKAMGDLVEVFNGLNRTDVTLVLTGYDNSRGLMPKESARVKPLLIEERQQVLNLMSMAQLLILHSTSEGFGLVLLESMWNRTPWVARHLAGAEVLAKYGQTYQTNQDLATYLEQFTRLSKQHINDRQDQVLNHYQIKHTVAQILEILK